MPVSLPARRPGDHPGAKTAARSDTLAAIVPREPIEDPLASTVSPDGLTSPAAPEGGPALARGDRVGRLVIEAELGRGGMGVVYAAHDPALDRRVAIKVLRSTGEEARARLLREGQALARLRHPNVVTVHDLGTRGEQVFITMELVEGSTLRAWWRARKRSAREVLDMLIAAGRGLAAAHDAGLVHRDFKPENVLVGRDGSVRVTDFGLARLAGGEPEPARDPLADTQRPSSASPVLTRTGALIGTPAYMAPEQHQGEATDARTDQFSFCVVLWEALCGERPFSDEDDSGQPSIKELRSAVVGGRVRPPPAGVDVPARVRRALDRGLAVAPERRFASMEELLAALEPPRRRAPLVAAVAGAGVAAALVAVAWARGGDSAPAPVAAPIACERTLARMDAAWSAGARAAYVARTRPIEREQDLPWLDEFAARWTSLRRATCDRERAAAAVPPPELAREAACLDGALASFEAAVGRPSTRLWPALASLTRCQEGSTAAPRLRPVAGRLEGDASFALSPDGARLASVTGDHIYVSTLEGVDERALPVAVGGGAIDWFADGKRLLLHPPGGGLLEVDAGTGATRPLFAPVRFAAVSPDGQQIAYSRQGRLELASLARPDQPPRLLAEVGFAAAEVAWSTAGDLLAAHLLESGEDQTEVERVSIFHLASGTHIDIRHRLLYTGFGLTWLPGRRLVINGEHDLPYTEGLWTLRLDERGRLMEAPELRIPAAERTQWEALDSGGRQVLLLRSDMGRMLMAIEGGKERAFPGRIGDWSPVAFDVVGRRLLSLREGRWGWLDPATGIASAIDLPRKPNPAVRAGKLLFLRSRAGGWDLVEDGGGAPRVLTGFDQPAEARPPSLVCAAAARPVCAVITHEPASGALTVIDPDGEVTTRPVDVREWASFEPSPDGRKLVVAGGHDVGAAVLVYDLRTLAVERRPTEPGCGVLRARWSRDSAAVIADLDCGEKRLVRYDRRGGQVLFRTPGSVTSYAVDDADTVYAGVLRFDNSLVLADGL